MDNTINPVDELRINDDLFQNATVTTITAQYGASVTQSTNGDYNTASRDSTSKYQILMREHIQLSNRFSLG